MNRQQRARLTGIVLAVAAASAVRPAIADPTPGSHRSPRDPATEARVAAAVSPSPAIRDAARDAARETARSADAPRRPGDEAAGAPPSTSPSLKALPKSCSAVETIGLAVAIVATCVGLKSCPGGYQPPANAPVCRIGRWI